MRAVVVDAHGGPEVLRMRETPDPSPGPGEVRVAVEAAGVNFIDVYMRAGLYPAAPPFVPGQEAAGVVAEVGADVRDLVVGDRVGWASLPGGYAEQATIPAERAVRLPGDVSTRLAAAVLLQGMTAHYLINDVGRVKSGDTVLVHAAAGGMGLLLTQMAKVRGARVLGTVSTDAKERMARDAGADEVIRYVETDVADAVRDLTAGAGADAVFDGVGAPTFDASLASLRPRGMLAIFGQAGGAVPPVDLQRLNAGGSLFVTRPKLADYIADRAELTARADAVLGAVASGKLSVHVGATFPMRDAARAHEMLESRRSAGKLLLLNE
ncbi:MAG: quinone oxidoreductase family protein [Stackebrandtia sp.]